MAPTPSASVPAASMAPWSLLGSAGATPMVPQGPQAGRGPTINLWSLAPADVIDIAETSRRPKSWPFTGGALVLIVLAAVTVLVATTWSGTGRDDRPPTVDVASTWSLEQVAGQGEAEVRVTLAGVPVGVVPARATGSSLEVDASYLRWTAAGLVEVEPVVDGRRGPARPVVAAHPWFPTGPSIALIIVGLWGLALVRSGQRRFRWGRFHPPTLVTLAVGGAMATGTGGLVLALASGVELRSLSFAVAAVLGAAAAMAWGEGYRRRRLVQRLRLGWG